MTDTLKKLCGYEVKGYRYEDKSNAEAKPVRDWVYLKDSFGWSDDLKSLDSNYDYNDKTWLSFSGRVGTVITGENNTINTEYTSSYLHFHQIEDGTYELVAASCATPEGSGKNWNTINKETLKNNNNLVQFNHYFVNDEGKEQAVEDAKIKDFLTLSFDPNKYLNVYQRDLMSEGKDYNDYTIGFTSIAGHEYDEAGNLVTAKETQYILPSGQCNQDAAKYKDNDKQIGTEVVSTPANDQIVETTSQKENGQAAERPVSGQTSLEQPAGEQTLVETVQAAESAEPVQLTEESIETVSTEAEPVQPAEEPTETTQTTEEPTEVTQTIEEPTEATQAIEEPTEATQTIEEPTETTQTIEEPTETTQAIEEPTETTQTIEEPTESVS